MIDGRIPDARPEQRLEERLEHLARLHVAGHLDDDEFVAAKALVLHPQSAGTTAGEASVPSVRTLGPLKWRTWMLIAVCVGFFVACVAAAVTPLQRPAGAVLCSNSTFVTGNNVQRYGSETSYDIVAACRSASGDLHQLSQIRVIGVLWAEYSLAIFAVVAPLIWVVRGLRGPARRDEFVDRTDAVQTGPAPPT